MLSTAALFALLSLCTSVVAAPSERASSPFARPDRRVAASISSNHGEQHSRTLVVDHSERDRDGDFSLVGTDLCDSDLGRSFRNLDGQVTRSVSPRLHVQFDRRGERASVALLVVSRRAHRLRSPAHGDFRNFALVQNQATRVSICNQTTAFCSTSKCTKSGANVTTNL